MKKVRKRVCRKKNSWMNKILLNVELTMGLLPSLKQRKRYIVFEVLSPHPAPVAGPLSVSDVRSEVQKSLQRFLGERGMALASPQWVKGNGQRFLIKVSHQLTEQAMMALLLCKKVKNTPVILQSIIASGTIKKASQRL